MNKNMLSVNKVRRVITEFVMLERLHAVGSFRQLRQQHSLTDVMRWDVDLKHMLGISL